MLETSGGSKTQNISLEVDFNQQVINHLSEIINSYLDKHPRITLNGLSKRCQVSEPTIRRIAKKQVKTIPNLSTVLDLLTNISKTTQIDELLKKHQGPVATFLKEAMPRVENQESEYSVEINSYLKNPNAYLIFKMSLNAMGVSREQVEELFGNIGLKELDMLVNVGIIKEDESGAFRSTVEHFTGSHDRFIDQFKATANFIKPEKYRPSSLLSPVFINASDSVNAEAYKEICKIQKNALNKIHKILSDKNRKGEIPLVYLCALDTLDNKSAFEIAQKNETH